MSGVVRRDARFYAPLFADQFKTLDGAEDVSRGGEDSGRHAVRRDHADGLATVTHGQAGARIEDVAVAAAVQRERAEVIAGGRDRLIGQSYRRPAFVGPVGLLKADVPRVLPARTAADADVLPDVDHHVGNPELPGHGDELINGEFFADPAEVNPH